MKPARRTLAVVLVVCIGVSALVHGAWDEQPEDQTSYIYDINGNEIYDFEFAKQIAKQTAVTGFDNLTFIFAQCHSGGMLDDLRDTLAPLGNIALLSSSPYDGTATIWNHWVDPNGFSSQESYYTYLIAEGLSLSGGNALTMRELSERTDSRNPIGGKETYQSLFLGEADKIRLGQTSSGKEIPPERRFALLFLGERLDTIWAKAGLDHIHAVLLDQGYLADNILVLASTSTGAARNAFGPGTREALSEALEYIFTQGRMGPDASFLFWTKGHGDQ